MHWTEVTRINFITVHLLGLEDSIRIQVGDSAPNLPLLPDDAGSPVKQGCYAAAGGKVVWAELSVRPKVTMQTHELHNPAWPTSWPST